MIKMANKRLSHTAACIYFIIFIVVVIGILVYLYEDDSTQNDSADIVEDLVISFPTLDDFSYSIKTTNGGIEITGQDIRDMSPDQFQRFVVFTGFLDRLSRAHVWLSDKDLELLIMKMLPEYFTLQRRGEGD